MKLSDLNLLGKISPYSYQRGETVYLEEDCDAGVFIDKLKSLGIVRGVNYEIVEGSPTDRSPIRSYKPFSRETTQ